MTSALRLGVSLPQFGVAVDEAARIGEFAARAEAAGAASLWVADRLLAASEPVVGYGGGDTIPEIMNRVLDPFTVLAAAAVHTGRATLGASVLIGPLYPPAILARSLSSVAALSGGRLLAGIGIGWSPDEYTAAGVGFDRRGKRLDDLLDALDALWSDEPTAHEGLYGTTPAAHVDRPEQHLPRALSAFSDAALRRTGRRADGWLPVARVGGDPEGRPESQAAMMLTQRAVIDEAAVAAGRDPASIATSLRVNPGPGTSTEQIADTVRRLVDATGFTDVFVDPMYVAPGVDERLALFDDLLQRLTG